MVSNSSSVVSQFWELEGGFKVKAGLCPPIPIPEGAGQESSSPLPAFGSGYSCVTPASASSLWPCPGVCASASSYKDASHWLEAWP
jgi:hypothetical protein